MAKSRAIEDALAQLHALRACPNAPEAQAEFRKALARSVNLVAAKAAGIVADFQIKGMDDDLIAAFDRFFKNAATSDKGCAAMSAIARALYELGAPAEEVFTRGIRHVQMEPSYGGPVDAAGELRAHCAMGLVRMGHREVMAELADLLGDAEAQVRMAAARALAYAGRDEGALLLRLKLHCGDKEPQVIEECMIALVKLTPARAVPLLQKFLEQRDQTYREAAALALGESRRTDAYEAIKAHWRKESDPQVVRALALGLAMTRVPEATEYLLSRLTEELPRTAADIVEALGMYKHDPAIRKRVTEIVTTRGDAKLKRAMEQAFG